MFQKILRRLYPAEYTVGDEREAAFDADINRLAGISALEHARAHMRRVVLDMEVSGEIDSATADYWIN